MRVVLQRVKYASCTIDGVVTGKIDQGLMLLVGICNSDTKEILEKVAKKCVELRIFEDENGKTNLSIDQVSGKVLVVSQFTLYADCKKGNRPSFTNAGSPDLANCLYEHIKKRCVEIFGSVECGEFGADMKVSLVNDGPFTLVLDSDEIMR